MSKSLPLTILLLLIALLANATLYVVKETERAVVLRFGAIVNSDVPPGLHIKLPFVDVVKKFDARILTMDARPESFFTNENKRLIVDAYAKWRIIDVDTFYRSTGGDEQLAQNRIAIRVNDGLRNEFGARTLREVVSGQRDELMANLTASLNESVREPLGVEVLDIRVKRIDLPTEVSEQVFRRMIAEREKEARELRSVGKEEAEKIRAAADRERTVIEATAYSDSEQIRGEGDAKAASIYARAFNKNPEFYGFMRSLTAYRESFRDKSDLLLVDPDSDFFKYLNDSKAGQ